MRILKRSNSQRLTVHAAAVGVAMLSSAVVIGNEAAERGAGPTPPALPEAASSFLGPICHPPTLQTNGLMRLAQTEVGPMGRQAGLSPEQFADKDPPLWDRVGAASFTVTTANGEAQKYFDQGLRLAYAFNHAEAQRAFRKAQKLDAACAMCYWGEALVLGPNINLPMGAEAVAPAFAAAGKAQSLAGRTTPREAALIAALAARYANDPKADRAALDKQYAGAMAKVAAQFPDDNEIAVLYAEAVMDISPWDYWEPDGRAPHPHSAAIVPTLERVLAKDPDHAGAIHYYISGSAFRQPGEQKELTQKQRQELATFGRVSTREEDDYSQVRGYVLEQWQLEDESAQGLRMVRRAANRGRRYAHGQLVGAKPGDSKSFTLGQVRWLTQAENGDLYAGVKLLPGLPAAVAVRPTGLNVQNEQYVPALSLTAVAALGSPPALVLPSGWFKPKRVIEVFVDSPVRARLIELIERGSDFERVAYEIL